MNRTIRDRLLTTERLLQLHIPADARQLLVQHQQVVKTFYDWNSKELSLLTPGESVRFEQVMVWLWEPAVFTAMYNSPRSYHVMTQDGQVYRCNRKHLRKTVEPPPHITPLPVEDQLANHATTMPQS